MILRRSSEAVLFGCHPVAYATRARLNNDSISASFDNRVATTDDSLGVGSGGAGAQDSAQSASASVGGSAISAKDEALVQGGFANKNVAGDDFSNAALQLGGLQIGGNSQGNISITTNNTAEGAESIASIFASTVENLANGARSVSSVGPDVAGDLSEQSGASEKRSALSVVVLAVAALGLLWGIWKVLRKRK